MLRASSSLRTAGEAKDRQLKLWFQKQTNMVASYACKNFLSMLMTGMLKVELTIMRSGQRLSFVAVCFN